MKQMRMNTKPNVVLSTSHDTRRYLHCYGVDSVHSPNLDRIAADGVRFTRFFATGAVCSPARAAMMSGLYPQRNGVIGLVHEPWLWAYKPGIRHLSHAMRDAGYHTVMFHHEHEALDISTLGFNDYRAREPVYPQGAMPDPYDHLTCEEVAADFVSFLQNRSRTDPPFYAQIGFFETHAPFDFGGSEPDTSAGLEVPGHLANHPDKLAALATFQGAIRRMDAAIGTMMDALKAAGMADNTIFVYTTDHGISFPKAKGTLYDSGTGVALIVRWPAGGLKGGRLCKSLLSNVDLFSTILELAGTPVPDRLDGCSIAGDLREGREPEGRDAVFSEMSSLAGTRESRSVRTDRFRLIRNFMPSRLSELGRHARHRTCPMVQLFDLPRDPGEYCNVAADPAYAEVKAGLERRLYAWLEEVGDPVLNGPVQPPYYVQAMADFRASAHGG